MNFIASQAFQMYESLAYHNSKGLLSLCTFMLIILTLIGYIKLAGTEGLLFISESYKHTGDVVSILNNICCLKYYFDTFPFNDVD